MGNSISEDSSPPPYNEIDIKKIDKCIMVGSTKSVDLDEESQKQLIKMLFLSNTLDEVCQIVTKEGIKVKPHFIPQEVLRNIIKNNNSVDFMKLFDLVINKRDFLMVQVDGKQLFLNIYENNAWKIVSQIVPLCLDLNFRNNSEFIKAWYKGDTFVHAIFWYHEYEVMIKIINFNKSLLYNINDFGLTPFDFFLMSIMHNNKYNFEKQTNIINSIGKKTFIKLSKNKTIKQHKNSKFTIPAGSTFTDILQIIHDKETNVYHQTYIKRISKCISEVFMLSEM